MSGKDPLNEERFMMLCELTVEHPSVLKVLRLKPNGSPK